MTSPLNGVSQNSRQESQHFLKLFCFLNTRGYFWLKSECLVSKCQVDLFRYAYTLFTYHTYDATFIFSKTPIAFQATLFSSSNLRFVLLMSTMDFI